MNWKQIGSRLTGISLGPVGASWQAPIPEVEIAQRVINFFEDRRVLFNPYELEVPKHCVDSVQEMRRFLTRTLDGMADEHGLPANLRAMRAACRKFLDTVQRHGRKVIINDSFHGGPDAWVFFSAVGELRATIGLHLSILAARNKLSISGDLTKIIPPSDADDKG